MVGRVLLEHQQLSRAVKACSSDCLGARCPNENLLDVLDAAAFLRCVLRISHVTHGNTEALRCRSIINYIWTTSRKKSKGSTIEYQPYSIGMQRLQSWIYPLVFLDTKRSLSIDNARRSGGITCHAVILVSDPDRCHLMNIAWLHGEM